MSGDNRVAPAAADRDGGALIPVFVADPSHVHGEHPLSGTRSRNEDAVSVERFFQQELASLSPDFTVRRGVHSEGTDEENDSTSKPRVSPRLMLHPDDKRRMVWDVMLITLLVYTIISVPVQIAFPDSSDGCSSSFTQQEPVFYVDLAVDSLFMIDVVVNLRTAFWEHEPNGKMALVTDQLSILVRYAKHWLFFDLIGAFPIDLLMLAFCNDEDNSNASNLLRAPKIIKQVRLLRAIKTLKVWRMKRILERIRDYFNIRAGYLKLLQLLIGAFLVLHYDACIMYWIGTDYKIDDSEDGTGLEWGSWVTMNDAFGDSRTGEANVPVKDLDARQAYLISFYWATTTVFTVGYGDITPKTTPEAAFTIIVLLQGGSALGYVLGSFAGMVARINIRKMRYNEMCEDWEDYFHKRMFPYMLRKRIRDFNQYKYLNPTSTLPVYAQERLSSGILRELTAHVYKDSFTSLPLFRSVVYADQSLATELALSLQHTQMPPLEPIYHEGREGTEMYFLHKGSIQMSIMLILNLNHEFRRKIEGYTLECKRACLGTQIVNFVKGDRAIECPVFNWVLDSTTTSHFGESVFFSSGHKRVSTAITRTEATMFTLSWDAVERLAQRYQAARTLIAKMKRGREPTLARLVRAIIQAKRAKMSSGAQLKIVIHSAESLPKMDAYAKCDPYVDLALDDAINPSAKNCSKSTVVCRNTYTPTWNQTFTFSLNKPEQSRAVDVRFALYDFDVLSQPDLVGSCTYDVNTLLKECMQQQREVIVEKQWIPLMIYKTSLLSRLKPSWLPAPAAFGDLEPKICPVKGHDRKPSRICCTISCSPPEVNDHNGCIQEQQRSLTSIVKFRMASRAQLVPSEVTAISSLPSTEQPRSPNSRSPQSRSPARSPVRGPRLARRSWARSVNIHSGENDPTLDEITQLLGARDDDPVSLRVPDSIDEIPQDPAALAPRLISHVQERARSAMEMLRNISPNLSDTDPASLLQSAMEAWSHVETLSTLINEESAASAREMKQLGAKLQEIQDLFAGGDAEEPASMPHE